MNSGAFDLNGHVDLVLSRQHRCEASQDCEAAVQKRNEMANVKRLTALAWLCQITSMPLKSKEENLKVKRVRKKENEEEESEGLI